MILRQVRRYCACISSFRLSNIFCMSITHSHTLLAMRNSLGQKLPIRRNGVPQLPIHAKKQDSLLQKALFCGQAVPGNWAGQEGKNPICLTFRASGNIHNMIRDDRPIMFRKIASFFSRKPGKFSFLSHRRQSL